MSDYKLRLVGVDETKDAINSAKNNLGSLDSVASGLKTTLAGLAAGLSIGAFATMVKGSIDAGVRITELSARLNAGTAALSQYKYVAEANSISLETLTGAWQKMQVNISKSIEGTGAAADALDLLGLSSKYLMNLAPEDQFELIADKLSDVDNASKRAELAMALFGKSGVQLLPIMEDGREGLRAMREEADRLGLTISESAAKQLSEFDDTMDRLSGRMEGMKNTIAISLLPALNDIAKTLEDTDSKTEAFRTLVESLGTAMKGLTFATMAAVEIFVTFGKTLGAVEAAKQLAYSGEFKEAANVFIALAQDEKASVDRLKKAYDDLFATKDAGFYGETSGKIDRTGAGTSGTPTPSTEDSSTAKALAEYRKLNEEKLKADQELLVQQASLEMKKFEEETRLSEERVKRSQDEAMRIFEATRTPMEQFQADYEAANKLREEGYFKRLGDEEAFYKYVAQLNNRRMQDEMKNMTMVQKWEQMTLSQRARFSFNTFADIFHAFSGNSKKMFEISKALSIVQTTMSTYEAAVSAYKALAGIPIVGPALGAAAAAAAIGFGMQQVSAIKGQSFGGGGGVTAVSVPGAPAGTGGTYPSPTDSYNTQQNNQQPKPPQTIYINIEGGDEAVLSGKQVRLLMEQINEQIGYNVRLNT